MKRFLNFRGFLFLALGFAAGVLCAYALWRGKGYWLAAGLGASGLGVLLSVVFRRKNLMLAFILILASLFCGFFETNAKINETNGRAAFENVKVRGVVTDISFNPDENGYGKFFLRDVYVFDGEKTTELDGGVQARFALEGISVGDEVVFYADVYPLALLSDGVQTYFVKNKIYYSCENVKSVSAARVMPRCLSAYAIS